MMQVFELHFNPKAREDVIFDTFCYEPENIYEKKLGNLYMAGEFKNAFPQNSKFLDNLASLIKKEYYTKVFQVTAETSLKNSLKKANNFLEEEAKRGNVNWLGNLSFAVLSLNNFILNFTKIGNVKILLSRNGEISDIGKNLESSKIQPNPLKVFGNIVSGKLAPEDKVIILTKEVFDFFQNGNKENNLIQELAKISEEKSLKEFFRAKEKLFLNVSGTCLLILLKKEEEVSSKPELFTYEKKPEKISLNKILSETLVPILKILKSLKGIKRIKFFKFLPKFPKLSFPKPTLPRPTLPKLILPRIKTSPEFKSTLKKKLILVFLLILVLMAGFFIFKNEREEELKEAKISLEKVNVLIVQAENFLILKNEEEANEFFQKAWGEVLPQTKGGALLKEEAEILKESIEDSLASLNKLERNPSLELLLEFEPEEIIPQKMLLLNSKLYFFNPFSSNLCEFKIEEREKNFLKAESNLKLAAVSSDSILFFAKPNILLSLKDNQWTSNYLSLPYPDFGFNLSSSFHSSIYFLDAKSGEIVKYTAPFEEAGQLWLNPKTEKVINGKSMAVDGNLWILTEEAKINRYYAGQYKEGLKLDFFPYLENPFKIWASPTNPYFYILEPAKNRLIILTKYGEMVKQYQSENFNNLLDFAVSKDGETIYFLNGSKVYQIKL